MPNWKKLLTSGSNIQISELTLDAAGVTKASIDTSGNIVTAGTISSSNSNPSIFRALSLKTNGISAIDLVANGVISASATVQGTAFRAQSAGVNKFLVDTSGNVAAEGYVSSSGLMSATSLDIKSAGVTKASIDTSGNITSPTSTIGLRDLDWQGNIDGGSAASAQGDVIYHATDTATTPGNIYAMNTSGVVVLADADAVATASTILCVALGENAGLGLLLRGTVVLRTSPGASPGLPIYLSTTAGNAQAAAPSETGDVVRVLGYQLTPNGEGDNVNVCYFNPDNTWVELT